NSPVIVLLVFAVVMILLGTFVDSLAILLVFAPVAVELCKRYGIDPIQMGLVMVICNQIGAVSPPTAPLLFVTTNIAQTTLDDTNRHVWTFSAPSAWCCCWSFSCPDSRPGSRATSSGNSPVAML